MPTDSDPTSSPERYHGPRGPLKRGVTWEVEEEGGDHGQDNNIDDDDDNQRQRRRLPRSTSGRKFSMPEAPPRVGPVEATRSFNYPTRRDSIDIRESSPQLIRRRSYRSGKRFPVGNNHEELRVFAPKPLQRSSSTGMSANSAPGISRPLYTDEEYDVVLRRPYKSAPRRREVDRRSRKTVDRMEPIYIYDSDTMGMRKIPVTKDRDIEYVGYDRYRESSTRPIHVSRRRKDDSDRTDRYRYESSDNSSDDEPSDTETRDDLFQFTLSRRAKSAFSLDSGPTEMESSEYQQRLMPMATGGDTLPWGALSYIFESRYVPKPGMINDQRLRLSVANKPNPNFPHLFRWVHLPSTMMQFADFQDQTAKIDGLSTTERLAITQLFSAVQEQLSVHGQGSKASRTRVLKPGFLKHSFGDTMSTARTFDKRRKLTWFCLPYFCLAKYSKNNAPTLRTILQNYYSAVTYTDNDIQQALRELPGILPTQGFHVAQIWCLILDDLPTKFYRSISVDDQKELQSHFVEFWPREARLSYKGERLDADSWASLLKRSEFKVKDIRLNLELRHAEIPAYAPAQQSLEFKTRPDDRKADAEQAISSEDNDVRARLVPHTEGEICSNTISKILPIQFELVTFPDSILHALALKLQDIGMADATSTESTKPTEAGNVPTFSENISVDQEPWPLSEFCALGWLVVNAKAGSNETIVIDSEALKKDLTEMDKFFEGRRKGTNHKAYSKCPKASHGIVQMAMYIRTSSNESSQDIDESHRSVFTFTESLFRFFLPLKFRGPTISRYWGAVGSLLLPEIFNVDFRAEDKTKRKASRREKEQFNLFELPQIETALKAVVRKTESARQLLSQMPTERRCKVEIPNSLVTAWLHVIASLTKCAACSYDWMIDMDKASNLIDEGVGQIMNCLSKESITKSIALGPLEIVAAITHRLVGDVTDGRANISSTYAEYTSNLERSVNNDPFKASHEDKIARLEREVEAALDVMHLQRSMASFVYENDTPVGTVKPRKSARTNVTTQAHYEDEEYILDSSSDSYLKPTDLGGYYGFLTRKCVDVVDEKVEVLRGVLRHSDDIKEKMRRRVKSNKSDQEAALYIFTIVTVIFLPLSTVASILGMNTNDIRNMNQDQWVFWAVAIPLVLFVIFLCLKLQGFWPGFTTLWTQGRLRLPFRFVWKTRSKGVAFYESESSSYSSSIAGSYYESRAIKSER